MEMAKVIFSFLVFISLSDAFLLTTHRPVQFHFRSLTIRKSNNKNDNEPNSIISDTRADASDALTNVGWSTTDSSALTASDPFVKKINSEIITESGVELDELLNPAKVVNLERDIIDLRLKLADATGVTIGDDVDLLSLRSLRSESFDGGGGGDAADKIRRAIEKKEDSLFDEKKSVFRGWLKNVFLGQAVLSFFVSLIMVTDPSLLFGKLQAYSDLQLETPIKVLGFWWWWLFIVPSLRSRRPKGLEKEALDIAFLATPLVSLLAPAATKDCLAIWAANLLAFLGSFAFAAAKGTAADDKEAAGAKQRNEILDFVFKSLDFGSGRERGVREYRIEEAMNLEQSEKTKRVAARDSRKDTEESEEEKGEK